VFEHEVIERAFLRHHEQQMMMAHTHCASDALCALDA
jgi:hypothetical protein